MRPTVTLLATAAASAACGAKTDADYRADVTAAMHDSVGGELLQMIQAARALQAAAPSHAWTPTGDAGSIAAMRNAWRQIRIAYETIEGAVVPTFGSLDHSMDGRYEDFVVLIGVTGDKDLFDGSGVTGMHGIERILYAPDIRPEIIAAESTLPGYQAAAYPASDAEALAFKTVLVQKLIDDAGSLRDQWRPAAIDVAIVYLGLVSLMYRQKEKLDLAALGQEESRYANASLLDLRNNLAGARQTYELFRPWLQFRSPEGDADAIIEARFADLAALYLATPDDALPAVPVSWDPDHPTPDDLATPFGQLWREVYEDVDPDREGSIVFQMNRVAAVLGLLGDDD